jgi:hypothetical protein
MAPNPQPSIFPTEHVRAICLTNVVLYFLVLQHVEKSAM